MKGSRLSQAVQNGLLVLPESGQIAIIGARAADDLGALPKARCEIIQGFKPDHDALARRGYQVSVAATGPYAMSIVMLPRAKAQARAMLAGAMALTPGGVIVVDGQKTDGVDAIYKECRKRLTVGEAYSKAHGKLFTFAAAPVFEDWTVSGPILLDEGFQTVAGVFSADKIDRGSRALIDVLPAKLPKHLADLGAGWGYLSRHILGRESVTELHLIEADHAALACARQNVTDSRARFHWADAAQFMPDQPFDGIITNPPFHTTRKADPDIGRAFIAAAAKMLKPSGQFWLVANRHLPYERSLAAQFRNVEEIAGDKAFKILHATRPLREARAGR